MTLALMAMCPGYIQNCFQVHVFVNLYLYMCLSMYISAHAEQYWHLILHVHANCIDCIV